MGWARTVKKTNNVMIITRAVWRGVAWAHAGAEKPGWKGKLPAAAGGATRWLRASARGATEVCEAHLRLL